jgi:hypothetical protein
MPPRDRRTDQHRTELGYGRLSLRPKLTTLERFRELCAESGYTPTEMFDALVNADWATLPRASKRRR